MSDTASGSQSLRSSPDHSRSNGSTPDSSKPSLLSSARPTEQPTVISSQPPLSTPSQAEGRYSTRPDRLLPGVCLGPFELIEYVGGGGMGHVYRATDKALGRTVALKVLSPEQVAEAGTLLRFRNEARSAARLNHENIVHVYYAGEEEGVSFIAFEFIEGTNIRQLVEQKGPLTLAEAISYTLQIADALAYASRQNVVHRDIKPSNVLVTPDGRAKLIDMGLARLQGPGQADDLTASGVTLGTFDYISPEQARDPRNADVRSDIYSLGCTLFFMLSGRPPFPEGTVLQKLLQHQGDEPPDVRQFRPDLPEELSRVLRRMMAKSPQQRYQDPAKLMEALYGLVQQVGLQPAGPGQRMWVVPSPSKAALLQRHLPWLAPVTILIVIVLLLHFLWDSPDREIARLGAPTAVHAAKDGKAGHALPPRAAPKAGTGSRDAKAIATPGVPSVATLPPASTPNARAASPVVPQPAAMLSPAGRSPVLSSVALGDSPPVAGQWTAAPTGSAGLSAAPQAAGGLSLRDSAGNRPANSDSPNPLVDPASVGRATPPAIQNRTLVVDGRGLPNCFATLKAACSAATNGDVIELRYSGRIQPETPITLANVQVTIRAAEGFQPVIAFRPTESDPVKYRRSMFSLSGSRISLWNLALELSIPDELPPDSWTLFDVDQAEALELRQCCMTIRNATGGWDVAFMRLKASPFADSVLGESLEQQRVQITLEDCVARGEAVLLHNEGMQPIQLQWNNGMLSTTEWLLAADCSDAFRPSYTTQLSLDHVTALIGRGLCQFNQTDYVPDQLVNIHVSNSILLGSGSSVLIEQNGVNDLERARQRIAWVGKSNFYEGFRIFWSISPRDASKTSEQMDYDSWLGHWTLERESNANCDLAQLKRLPQKNRPVHTHVPADFLLDETRSNAAIGSGGDRRNAGMLMDRIPDPPPVPDLFRPATGNRTFESVPAVGG